MTREHALANLKERLKDGSILMLLAAGLAILAMMHQQSIEPSGSALPTPAISATSTGFGPS